MGEGLQNRLEEALKAMKREGRLTSAVLATADGLPLASAPGSRDPEATAAMAALLRGTVNQVCRQMDLAQTEEVDLVGSDGMRLVCRYLSADEDLILVVVAPPDQSYRRMTTQAIRAIKAVLSGQGQVG